MRRRWLVGLVVAGLLALVACQSSEPAAGPAASAGTTGPASSATPTDTTPPEEPAPAVPAGWQVLDTGDLRLAAPPGWTTPLSEACAFAPGAGVVVKRPSGNKPEPLCSPAPPPAPSAIEIEPGAFDPIDGTPVQLGALRAVQAPIPPCEGCTRYRVASDVDVIARGPEADAVLATLSLGGARRAVAAGPLVDTTGWVPVDQGGVSVLVPAAWAQRQIGAPPTTVITPTGERVGGGITDPGACGGPLFSGAQPTAFVGLSLVSPSCPAPVRRDLTPADGVWIHEDRDQRLAQTPTPPTTVGHARAVVDSRPADGGPGPVARVLVPARGDAVEVVVGVGADPAVARTILSTLRVDR